jgi:hypothetical protein
MSEPGITRFRLPICARMRQPVAAVLDLPNLMHCGHRTRHRQRYRTGIAAHGKHWRKCAAIEDSIGVWSPWFDARRDAVVLLLPVPGQLVDDARKTDDGLHRRVTGLCSARRSMSIGLGAKRTASLFSNASCPARTAAVTPDGSTVRLAKARSRSIMTHRGEGPGEAEIDAAVCFARMPARVRPSCRGRPRIPSALKSMLPSRCEPQIWLTAPSREPAIRP